MNEAEKHSAGAIVTHHGKFESLAPYMNEKEISQEFRRTWVIPYYMELNRCDDEWIKNLTNLKSEINDEIILQNLGDFNWRSRSVGSFFASITNKKEYIEIIGTHMLKSEVCYAGAEYAVALAHFNNDRAIHYLNKYLRYYLLHPELYFDQIIAISALKWLDQKNETDELSKHEKNWNSFVRKRRIDEKKSEEEVLASPSISQEIKQDYLSTKNRRTIDANISTEYIVERTATIKTIANSG